MLRSFPSKRMTSWPVDKRVGNVKNTEPELIEHVPIQASLI
jgi:putative SOS response-associated peptidase YedK